MPISDSDIEAVKVLQENSQGLIDYEIKAELSAKSLNAAIDSINAMRIDGIPLTIGEFKMVPHAN